MVADPQRSTGMWLPTALPLFVVGVVAVVVLLGNRFINEVYDVCGSLTHGSTGSLTHGCTGCRCCSCSSNVKSRIDQVTDIYVGL